VTEAAVVYNYPRTLERELAKLRAECVGKENSEIILCFYRQLVAEGIGIARQIKYLSTLRLIAHGKIGHWFNAFGGFFIQQTPLMSPPNQNVTVSLCQFKMKNYTSVELNFEGNDLYVEGFWNVYNITFNYFDDELTYNRTLIVDGGYGQLNVTLGSDEGKFTLTIEGIQEVSGDVVFYHVKYCRPFDHGSYRFGIPMTDLNGNWEVDIHDLIHVAKSYGSMAGKPRYGFDLDFNLDFAVNILDLYTIAKDYGQEY